MDIEQARTFPLRLVLVDVTADAVAVPVVDTGAWVGATASDATTDVGEGSDAVETACSLTTGLEAAEVLDV